MSTFDPLICASLHNRIAARAVSQDVAPPLVRNLFHAYGELAENIRHRLSNSIIQFLENIDVPSPQYQNAHTFNFTPHLAFPHPNFWVLNSGMAEVGGDEEEHEEWIVLYTGTTQEVGLYYDMKTDQCAWTEENMPWPQHWCSLFKALTLYLTSYESGRFLPSTGEAIANPTAWIRYIPNDLDRTITAYDALVRTIMSHMPHGDAYERNTTTQALISPTILHRHGIRGFPYDFLTRAVLPPFTCIAPGLRLPSDRFIDEIYTADLNSPRYHLVRSENLVPDDDNEDSNDNEDANDNVDANFIGEPLPIFPGQPITERSPTFAHDRGLFTFGATSGLYLFPSAHFADTTTLILPRPVGGYGWMDHRPVAAFWPDDRGTWNEGRAANDRVYERFVCPALLHRGPRLYEVLEHWQGMVEMGVWEVDGDGVVGDWERFRDADTEDHAAEFQLGQTRQA